jgi:hypothetical protein
LEEHVSSIFEVEEYARQETSLKEAAFTGLHSSISQKMDLFIVTTVKTSNPTNLV